MLKPSPMLAVARFGTAHWLFGNVYEEVVRMPSRLGPEDSIFGHDSPVRYYLPAAPLTFAATMLAAVDGRQGKGRGALVTAVVCSAIGAALTAYLVRSVVVPLMDNPPVQQSDRERLARHWHRVNRVRIAFAGTALIALETADKRAGRVIPRR